MNYAYIGNSGTGSFTQSGGTSTIATWLYLGNNSGSTGSYALEHGQLSTPTEYVGYWGTGTFTQSGGVNTASNALYVAYSHSGAYSLTGSGQLFATAEYVGVNAGNWNGTFLQSGGTNVANAIYLGNSLGTPGRYDLNGGLLATLSVASSNGTATFNLNGGTLQASGNNSAWVAGLTATYVRTGGAIFDVQGFNDTISQTLLHDPSLSAAFDGGLVKCGAGILTLGSSDTFTGNTLITAGTLALGSSLAIQNSTLDTGGSGALSFGDLNAATIGGLTGAGTITLLNSTFGPVALSVGNNYRATTYSGRLANSGSLVKIGSGTLSLTGSNTYTGPTSINQGSLVVNGSLVSPVTVNSGGLLGGTGTLSSVTVGPSGSIAPGNPLGTLTLSGGLVLESGAVMDYESRYAQYERHDLLRQLGTERPAVLRLQLHAPSRIRPRHLHLDCRRIGQRQPGEQQRHGRRLSGNARHLE